MRTFEACSPAEGMDLGGGQSRPGVVGWGEGEAVGWVKCQRGGRMVGHSMFETDGCLDISRGESTVECNGLLVTMTAIPLTFPDEFRAKAM